jgi:hypothetical protein
LGGLVAASSLGYQWNFYLFAGFALLGAVLIALVPRRPEAVGSPLQPAVAETTPSTGI